MCKHTHFIYIFLPCHTNFNTPKLDTSTHAGKNISFIMKRCILQDLKDIGNYEGFRVQTQTPGLLWSKLILKNDDDNIKINRTTEKSVFVDIHRFYNLSSIAREVQNCFTPKPESFSPTPLAFWVPFQQILDPPMRQSVTTKYMYTFNK